MTDKSRQTIDQSEHSRKNDQAPRPLISGADVYIVAIIGVMMAGLIVSLSGNFNRVVTLLYHPLLLLIVVTICATYVFIKSSDRTRMYKNELEMVKELRRDELASRRKLELSMKSILDECRNIDGKLNEEQKKDMEDKLEKLIEDMGKS